ncbi:MAG: tRNA 2-thiouridine(34) synthase MnmA, partial [Planctomycetota bacterium]
FGRIIDYFHQEYADGRTPNPCVRCNDWLKFGKLHDYARQIDADIVASGHYARVTEGVHGQPQLRCGRDANKDQSYVLFGVPKDRLVHMMLPIGEYETKSEVRALADEMGLPVFDKPDSQEICFVPNQDYAGFLERRDPELSQQGDILDRDGNVVGSHDGQHRFTLGQRRGVGVALGYPIYVVDKNPQTNTVTIGSKDELMSMSCACGEANWLVTQQHDGSWRPCMARHRYNSEAVLAQYRVLSDAEDGTSSHSGRSGRFEIRFDEPQLAVTPGQALVVYDADETDLVLGGGWIETVDG